MKQALILYALIMSLVVGFSQTSENLIITNARPIDPERYADIQGSPYMFDDWLQATIVGLKDKVYEGVWVKYNGHERAFEIKDGNEYTVLDEQWFLEVKITRAENPENYPKNAADVMVFQRGAVPKALSKFAQVIYKDDNLKLVKDFYVNKGDHKVENVGKTVTFERFSSRTTYYLIKDGKSQSIRPKSKFVVQALGGNKEVAAFIKKNKLAFKSDVDFVKVMEFYASL